MSLNRFDSTRMMIVFEQMIT